MQSPERSADVRDGSTARPTYGPPLDAAADYAGERGADGPDPPVDDLLLAPERPSRVAPPHAWLRELRFAARRWSIADVVIGFASLVLAISLFLDWYTFNVPFIGSASRSGTWTSEYLYAAFALSVEAVVYLAARSVWSELQLKGRFVHHAILIGLTTGSLAVTLIAFVTKPALTLLGIPIPVDWAYGAYIAVPAAVVAMVASVGQLVGNLAGARSAPVTAEPEGRPADLATAVPETHEAQPSAAQTPSSCPRCGAPRGLDDRFCARCGASFEEGAMGQGGHRSAAA